MKTKMRLDRLQELGLTYSEALALRRCAMALSRWAELECGSSDSYKSWAIERDDQAGYRMDREGCVEDSTHKPTGKPFMVSYMYDGRTVCQAIPDREAGALKRVKATCDAKGLYFYHQSDPRGASLYIWNEPLTDSDYPKGAAVYK